MKLINSAEMYKHHRNGLFKGDTVTAFVKPTGVTCTVTTNVDKGDTYTVNGNSRFINDDFSKLLIGLGVKGNIIVHHTSMNYGLARWLTFHIRNIPLESWIGNLIIYTFSDGETVTSPRKRLPLSPKAKDPLKHVQNSPKKGFYDGCTALDNEADLELCFDITEVGGKPFLEVGRDKHAIGSSIVRVKRLRQMKVSYNEAGTLSKQLSKDDDYDGLIMQGVYRTDALRYFHILPLRNCNAKVLCSNGKVKMPFVVVSYKYQGEVYIAKITRLSAKFRTQLNAYGSRMNGRIIKLQYSTINTGDRICNMTAGMALFVINEI